jgi:hypothetical protein
MGIDIEVYIRAEPTPELLGKLRALSKERDDDGDCKYWVIESVRACTCYDEKPPHIHISSCHRYFGQQYPRGYWPKIRESLMVLKDACPPGTQIEYGNDSSDLHSGVVVDEMLLSDLDAYWTTLNPDEPLSTTPIQ